MKKLFIAIIGIFFFSLILNIPQKTNVDKVLNCIDAISQDTVIVTVSGTMYSYLLKNDLFTGTIEIQGKRKNTGTFELEKDMYTNLVDNYGQPMEIIMQFENFSYISVAGGGCSISNEWNPEWNEKLQRKRNVNKLLDYVF